MGALLRSLAAIVLAALALPAAPQAPPRILYFNDDDPRTPATVEKLRHAIQASPWQSRRRVEVELVTVRFDDPQLAARIREAVERTPGVAALLAPNGVTALAARDATATLPIVFGMHQDPVALGVVKSLRRPGANLTGFTFHAPVEAKRLALLLEVLPRLRRVGVIHDRWWIPDPASHDFEVAARKLGLEPEYFEAETAAELERLLASRPHEHIEAWYVYSGPSNREPERTVAAINATCRPAIFDKGSLTAHGALLTFQPTLADPYGIWAKLLGRVLAGDAPGDIPVDRPKDFELRIHLRSARACGIKMPPTLLRRANSVLDD